MSNENQVTRYFTENAEVFDSLYMEKQMHPIMRYINHNFRSDIYVRYMLSMEYIKSVNAKTVLDVGCGSGRYALGLENQNLTQYHGIDFSPNMIELAKNYTKELQANHQNLTFTCCDFLDFSSEEKYDVIMAMGFFDYTKDPVLYLKKMAGLCRHSVIGTFPSISFYRTPIRKVRYYLKRCPVYFYKPMEIEKYAAEAGFSSCKIQKIKGDGMDNFVTFYK